MLDFLFAFIIAPLRGAMEWALLWAHGLGGSWGWSIVFMSIAVNIALIPVYHLAESWQEDERALQRKMAGKLAEIKAVYLGRERYMFTRAVYRMFGYHPLLALRTSMGLLIQIPFFFAAYNLLNGNPALQGASFFFIGDLGRPDALLALGGLSLNLLPFVMTAVNLASAAVYSARLTRRDKIQLYALAALFLLLLYNASAGLLLYWTCNNIISFFKNIVYSRYIYADSGRELPAQPGLAPLRQGAAAFWRACAALPGRADLICIVLGIVCCVLGEAVLKAWAAVAIMAVGMLLAALAAFGRSAALRQMGGSWNGVLYFAWLIGFITLLGVYAMIRENRLISVDLWWYSRFYGAFFAFAAVWLAVRQPLALLFERGLRGAATILSARKAGAIFAYAALLVALVVFIYMPLNLYSSDPEAFSEKIAVLLGELCFMAMAFLALCACAWRLAGASARPWLAACLGWVATAMLFYVFVAVGNYGVLEQLFFQDPAALRTRWAPLVDMVVLVPCGLFIYFMLCKAGERKLLGLLQALCLAMMVGSAYKLAVAPEQQLYEAEAGAEPRFSERLWSFSPQGRNVIILMLDGFTGSLAQDIFADDPELAKHFEGFVFYTEAMSPGSCTLLGVPVIMGGSRYTPWAINSRQPESIREAMQEAFAELPRRLLPKDYDVALGAVYFLQSDLMEKYLPQPNDVLTVGAFLPSTYVPLWRETHGLPDAPEPSRASFLASAGFLYAAPWSLRNNIYGGGRWLNTQSEAQLNTGGLGDLAMLDMMSRVSNTRARKLNTFKYISAQPKHIGLVDSATGYPADSSTPPERAISGEHFALRAVARWLDWLKANELYDNTQIILVADHSTGSSTRFPKGADRRDKAILKGATWRPHVMLMVKNFETRGPFRLDSRLASNVDIVPAIAAQNGLEQIYDYENYLNDPHPDPNRLRTHDAGRPSIRRHPKNRFDITHYEIRGDMFDVDNWKLVEERK